MNPTRSLQPIEFIEHWSLCHHLGCVVKYLARAGGRGASGLDDLKSAQWYLARELECSHNPSFGPLEVPSFIPKSALNDWHLSFHLGQTLFHIQVSQKVYHSPYLRGASLKQAMKHLAEEIKIYEH